MSTITMSMFRHLCGLKFSFSLVQITRVHLLGYTVKIYLVLEVCPNMTVAFYIPTIREWECLLSISVPAFVLGFLEFSHSNRCVVSKLWSRTLIQKSVWIAIIELSNFNKPNTAISQRSRKKCRAPCKQRSHFSHDLGGRSGLAVCRGICQALNCMGGVIQDTHVLAADISVICVTFIRIVETVVI